MADEEERRKKYEWLRQVRGGQRCDHKAMSDLIVSEGEPKFSEVANDRLHLALKQFWDTEAIGIESELMTTDVTLDPEFLKNIQYRNNHYEVLLPWRRDSSDIADHYNLCSNRLHFLHQRLLKKPEILKEYDRILKEQLRQGIIEPTDDSNCPGDEPVTHYLPHHAVIRQDRTTTKVRIAYDGSAKSDKHDSALNEFLYTGPNFIPKLFNILVKFRSYPIALTANIKKAFLMIGIAPDDRNKLRFLWLKNPFNVESDFIQYRLQSLCLD